MGILIDMARVVQRQGRATLPSLLGAHVLGRWRWRDIMRVEKGRQQTAHGTPRLNLRSYLGTPCVGCTTVVLIADVVPFVSFPQTVISEPSALIVFSTDFSSPIFSIFMLFVG